MLATVLFAPMAAVGGESRIEDFRLPDYRGHEVALSEVAGPRATVVVFLGVECPLARLYAPRLAALAAEYQPRGVGFVGINSNRQDLPTELAHFARQFRLNFPLLKDPGNLIADRFGATRTPETFVLDAELAVRYHGRIDDQYQPGVQAARVSRHDLKEALEDLLAGREVRQSETEVTGCIIGRVPAAPSTAATVTWSRQISRIFQRHCQECHRPGEIGPMPFLSYADVSGWEGMIREVVNQGRMPPWHASPEYGRFVNDIRLSAEEKALIEQWVDQGAPEGDPADLPAPLSFSEGWHIPQPDQVVYMREEPFTVPAEGVVEYQWFEADPGFQEDKWVKAAECRPGNRSVVHHVTVYYKPPGVPFSLALGRRINLLSGYAPGKTEVNSEYQGRAFFLPAGTRLLFEMHYTPNGTVQQDRSAIGLIFARPDEVEKQMHCVLCGNDSFAIPPGARNHRVESFYRFDEDSLLYSMSPHMHLRGKSFRFDLIEPAGRRETLLYVPRFDFGWQTNYQLVEPRIVPKGSIMQCIAHFDNSKENPVNPDPAATVRWGDQSWEEMMIGAFAIAPLHQDLRRGQGVAARSFDPSQWWYPQYTGMLTLLGMVILIAAAMFGWRRIGAVRHSAR
jgi:peroxiredoxin/mono/diheme cytochrome c family protein